MGTNKLKIAAEDKAAEDKNLFEDAGYTIMQ